MNYLFLALPILALSISHSPIAQESENSDSVDSADSQKTEEQAPEKAYLKDKSVWISDEFLVPLRSTPCARCTIVHRGLKSGTKLQLLEMVDGWGHLITNRGVEGWAEEQYLVDQPIARIRVKTQEKELAALKEDMDQMKAEMEAELAEVQAKWDSIVEQIDEYEIAPYKKNIDVYVFGLGWPYDMANSFGHFFGRFVGKGQG